MLDKPTLVRRSLTIVVIAVAVLALVFVIAEFLSGVKPVDCFTYR